MFHKRNPCGTRGSSSGSVFVIRTAVMPKQKTNKGVRKRMKITATGKVKHHKSNRRHLMTNRTSKVKRHSRGTVCETGRVARKYILPMGGQYKPTQPTP